jgi:hypothetical protein
MAKGPSGGVKSINGGGFRPTSMVHGVGAQPPRNGAVAKPVFPGGANSISAPVPATKKPM